MKSIKLIILFLSALFANSCVSKFIPETNENTEMLVVDGMITDQPGPNIIKLYKSMPLGKKISAVPVRGCNVIISDDQGNSYDLYETTGGTYVSDSAEFCGIVGRTYTLRIFTRNASTKYYSYESLPMEMKPVPPIDKIYYEKETIEEASEGIRLKEGCQVYMDTYDPEDKCKFYRWNYTETWEIRLPFDVPNKICWITNNSGTIILKKTSVLSENRINRLPLIFISNETDRLMLKYSMLVNQYSLNEDEFVYWEKMRNITEEVGSLYDITPASIPSNIYCIDDPTEKVLGYFSVSAKSSKRIFIDDVFSGIVELYKECENARVGGSGPIQNLGLYVWIIEDCSLCKPSYRALTFNKGCADCTVRGTTVKPPFWDNK
jgi:hypothetical protein